MYGLWRVECVESLCSGKEIKESAWLKTNRENLLCSVV